MISYGRLRRSSDFGSKSHLIACFAICCLTVLTSSSSLKNHDLDKEIDGMFEMGVETIALPLEEKMQFELGEQGGSYG